MQFARANIPLTNYSLLELMSHGQLTLAQNNIKRSCHGRLNSNFVSVRGGTFWTIPPGRLHSCHPKEKNKCIVYLNFSWFFKCFGWLFYQEKMHIFLSDPPCPNPLPNYFWKDYCRQVLWLLSNMALVQRIFVEILNTVSKRTWALDTWDTAGFMERVAQCTLF